MKKTRNSFEGYIDGKNGGREMMGLSWYNIYYLRKLRKGCVRKNVRKHKLRERDVE